MGHSLTTVIIEDETLGAQSLASLIENYAPDLKIVGMATDVESGVCAILEKVPQLVFLDIRLGNRSGFDIIRQVPNKNFYLVITSAYEEYALEAFRVDAMDYLLKPITKEDMLKTIQRMRERKNGNDHAHTLEAQWPLLQKSFDCTIKERIAVPTANGLIFISLNQLLRCEADGVYTKLVVKASSPVLTTRNLGEYEKILLPSAGFLRIHHSVIVNMNEVARYIRGDGGQVIMSDGTRVDVSRRKKIEFMNWIEKI